MFRLFLTFVLGLQVLAAVQRGKIRNVCTAETTTTTTNNSSSSDRSTRRDFVSDDPDSEPELNMMKRQQQPLRASSMSFPFVWENEPQQNSPIVCKIKPLGANHCYTPFSAVAHEQRLPPSGAVYTAIPSAALWGLGALGGGEQVTGGLECAPTASTIALVSRGAANPCEAWFVTERPTTLTAFDVQTGRLRAVIQGGDLKVQHGEKVTWVGECGAQLVACGTGPPMLSIEWDEHNHEGHITTVDSENYAVHSHWVTGAPAFSYCFHLSGRGTILSGHDGDIRGWSLSGERTLTCRVPDLSIAMSGPIYSLSSHPSEPRFLSGGEDMRVREWELHDGGATLTRTIQDISSEEDMYRWAYGGNWAVSYSRHGDKILTTEPHSQALRVWAGVASASSSMAGGEGEEPLLELKGHPECITSIAPVGYATPLCLAQQRLMLAKALFWGSLTSPPDGEPESDMPTATSTLVSEGVPNHERMAGLIVDDIALAVAERFSLRLCCLGLRFSSVARGVARQFRYFGRGQWLVVMSEIHHSPYKAITTTTTLSRPNRTRVVNVSQRKRLIFAFAFRQWWL
eukprot:COSAG05_NODE_212_length_13942_cov_18.039659_2_plen_571_part_00